MRPSILTTLALTSLAACFPASNGDDAPSDADVPDADTGNTPSDPHNLTINWHFKGLDGNAIPCPAGFSVMEVWITNTYDGYWQETSEVPCSSANGTYSTTVFTAGRTYVEEEDGWWTHGKIHDIRLRVTEPTGESTAAGAPTLPEGSPPDPGRFITIDQDTTVDFDIYPGGGWGVAKWHLVSNNTGANLISCAAAGVDTIRFTYFVGYYPGTTTPIVTEWPCDAKDIDFEPDASDYQLGSGRTRAVPPETYYGTFEALRNGVVVGTRGGDGDAIGFDSDTGNRAFRITNANITINDR
jgi:hypothetical protein